MGLFANLIIFFLLFLFIWLTILTLILFSYYRKQKLISKAASQEKLPQIIFQNQEEIAFIQEEIKKLKSLFKENLNLIRGAVRKVGVVRFDAFEDTGGQLSYSIALLNDNGDGIVLTTLNGRSESRSYAKLVKGAHSTYSLSEEEKEAIRRALES